MASDPLPLNDDRPAGPGAIEVAGEAPNPILQGYSEYEYVEILNPLSVTFIGQFGITKPANAPVRISISPDAPGVSRTEQDIRTNYGLDLHNPDHRGSVNIINKVSIPSGKTVKLLGNEAQVVVNQLVTEIMQRKGQRLLLADPFARSLVEADVIISKGSVSDLMDNRPVTVHDQLQEVVDNIGDNNEQAFPGINESVADTITTSKPISTGVADNNVSPQSDNGSSQDPGNNTESAPGASDRRTVATATATKAKATLKK